MPKVSTIIPCHNEGPLLREAVRSALAQSHPETEVIVVADGPQNGQTQAILDELEANRQVRVLAKPQGGVSSARNFGIEEADGEYLLFLDADDLIDPSFAARGVEIFESTPEALIVGGQVVMFGAISGPYGPPFRLNQFLHESLLPVGHMVHTADARRVGASMRACAAMRTTTSFCAFWASPRMRTPRLSSCRKRSTTTGSIPSPSPPSGMTHWTWHARPPSSATMRR